MGKRGPRPSVRTLQVMPEWERDGAVPFCSERCPSHDGKRCGVLGARPERVCEPAVKIVIEATRAGKCPCETELEGAPPWHLPSCPYSDPNYDTGGP